MLYVYIIRIINLYIKKISWFWTYIQ